jgi:hypothetical protein
VRARCGSTIKDGGAERARQVVIGGNEHLKDRVPTGLPGTSGDLPALKTAVSPVVRAEKRLLTSGGGPRVFPYRRQEVNSVAGQREAYELLLIEEADAWFEYLETTRAQSALRYREVEPWAWARLSQRLRAIKTRRAKLKPATEAA